MEDLREIRRKMHECYLQKKKEDEEKQEQIPIEEEVEIQQQILKSIHNEVHQLIAQENNEDEEQLQQEDEENENAMEHYEDENQDEEDHNDEDEEQQEFEEEEEEDQPIIQGMPQLPPGFPGGMPGMMPGMNFGGMFGGGYQPFQPFQGSGNQLSDKEYFGPNPSLQPLETEDDIRAKHAKLIQNRMESNVVIDDSLGNISPPISSKQQNLLAQKKLVIKSLVEMCVQKLSIDLHSNQNKLKLLPSDLMHRIIENMNNTGKMNKTKLNQMVIGGAKITELNLNHQFAVVNNDFLLNSLPNMIYLTKIYFRNCHNITDLGMETFRKLKNITVLDLRDNKITDVGIRNIKNLVTLEELYLRNIPITDKGVTFFDGLKNLKTLDISRCKITDQSLLIVNGFLKLEHLFLGETLITDKGIQMIIKLPLIQLNLSNCINITNQGLFFITYFGETLRVLDIFQTKIFGAGLVNLKKLTKLTSITLPGRESFNDGSVTHLNPLVNVRKLDFTDYIHLTSISTLTNLIYLVELSLCNTKISDDSLHVVKDMTMLEVLLLDRTSVSDQGIPLIKKLGLLTLSLMSTQITGECLRDIGEISTLQNLNISFNAIDSKNMKYLTQLQDLTSLDLRGTDTINCLNIFDGKIQIRPPVIPKPIPAINPMMMNEDDDGEDEEE